jgi:hypothetical protein
MIVKSRAGEIGTGVACLERKETPHTILSVEKGTRQPLRAAASLRRWCEVRAMMEARLR